MLSQFFFSLSLHSYFTIQTDPRNLDVFKLRLYNRFLLHVRLLFLFTSACLIQYYGTYILQTATWVVIVPEKNERTRFFPQDFWPTAVAPSIWSPAYIAIISLILDQIELFLLSKMHYLN